MDEDQIRIYGRGQVQNGEAGGSVQSSMADQFSSALVRLQADLNSTNSRLTQLESRLNQIQKQTQQQQQQSARGMAAGGSQKNLLSSSAFQLTWPVLVYLGLKVFERPSSSATSPTNAQ